MTYSQFLKGQKSFHSQHGIIKYIDKGQGDVIVLLHGVPTSGWLYRKMIDQLSESHRVIVPDMLGFGASDSPKGYDLYAPEEHATRLLSLMNNLQIPTWNHVFHDAGGLWTWELLSKAPERVSNLIILNTIIYEEGFQPPIRFNKGIIAQIVMTLYRNGITTSMMLKGLFKSGLSDPSILSKEDLQGYKKPLLQGKTNAMYHFFTNTCNNLPDYSKVIQNLNMPKMIIWGKEDEFLVFDKMKNRAVNDLKLEKDHIYLIEAKHFIQEEKPKDINALILSFIEAKKG